MRLAYFKPTVFTDANGFLSITFLLDLIQLASYEESDLENDMNTIYSF